MIMGRILTLAALGLTLTTGCNKSGGEGTTPPPTDTATDTPKPAPTGNPEERPAVSDAECTAKGGTVVGDIGDGAIHRPDYVCPSGQPPLGSIKPEGGAVPIEGSVCCPAAPA